MCLLKRIDSTNDSMTLAKGMVMNVFDPDDQLLRQV